MSCIALIAQPLTMATTPLVRVVPRESRLQFDLAANRASVRMNWVVVTDIDGKRQLRMQWKPARER